MKLSVDEVRRQHATRIDKWGVPTRQPDFEARREEMFHRLAVNNRRAETANLYGTGRAPGDGGAMLEGGRRRYRTTDPLCRSGESGRAPSGGDGCEDASGGDVTARRPWLSRKVLLVVIVVALSNIRRLAVVLQSLAELAGLGHTSLS